MGFEDVENGRLTPPRGPRTITRRLSSRRTFIMGLCCLLLYMLATVKNLDIANMHGRASTLLDRRRRSESLRLFRSKLMKEYPAEGDRGRVHRTHNFAALERLRACTAAGTCGPHEDKIILLGSHHFGGALAGPVESEERLWAASTLDAFQGAGYTTLISFGVMDTLYIYQGLADMVRLVYWEPEALKRCIARNASTADSDQDEGGEWQLGHKACIQSRDYPEGVPYWKSVVFHFWGGWGGQVNPLGAFWTLAPENWATLNPGHARGDSHYVGYSVERMCKKQESYRPYQRKHVGAILGNRDLYFGRDRNMFFGLLKDVEAGIAPALADHAPFQFLVMAGEPNQRLEEPGLFTIGKQPLDAWTENVARSKVLVGLGSPAYSPAVYMSMCFGTPFVNVVKKWDHENPDDRDKWETQSDPVKHLDSPYVYNVHAGSPDELIAAMEKALDAPLERYIPDDMKMENVIRRHAELAEINWQEECRKTVAQWSGVRQVLSQDYCMDVPEVPARKYTGIKRSNK